MQAPPEGAAAARFGSLGELLRHRAAVQPEAPAYTVLSDRGRPDASLTFAAVAEEAEALARRIAACAAPGERALLLCPTGTGFLIGFFGCVLAGVVAVPLMLPRRQGRSDVGAAIVADCAPRLALAPAALIAGERGDLVGRFAGDLAWLAVDDEAPSASEATLLPAVTGDDLVFLQYTSGSTSAPKGVMVSHAGLLANLAMIAQALGNTRAATHVSWLPLYHDMGLILNVLQSLFVGAHCVLLAPVAFVQRPILWLRAISEYRAEVAGGPNFGFDLCVDRYRPEQMAGIDLSGWRLALNGAEPVRADTLRRFAETFAAHGFAAEALYPAYGMAEATVLISGGRRGAGPVLRTVSRDGLRLHRSEPPQEDADAQTVVGCGRALAGEAIAIVDPDTRARLAAGAIGEIWVAGPHVARGYWRNPAVSAATFGAAIAGEPGEGWLRTGDLGFLDAAGEVFITGRIKEVVLIRGVNHYPQDIEHTVQGCDPALTRHGGAAFTVPDARGAEALVIVQEVERSQRAHVAVKALVGRIREAVVNEHDVVPQAIALLRPGALPKTTSGKIQRALARALWLEDRLERLEAG